MAKLRRSFRDDFVDTLDRLVQKGTIDGYETDIDGSNPDNGLYVLVKAQGVRTGVDVALLRDKVRQALADLTDNVIIKVEQNPKSRG